MSSKQLPLKTVKQEQKWTLFSSSQSLSAALNDPACREYDFFTKTWGSYFIPNAPLPLPPTDLPKIELVDFQRYIKETAAGRKVHRALLRQLRSEGHQVPESPKSGSHPADSPRTPVRSLHLQLLQDGQTYDLSEVPKIFMQPNFSLGHLETFKEVIPLTLSLSPFVGRRRLTAKDWELHQTAQHSAQLLHEKLSHYLDIVEVHLAHEIAQKSDIFFDTLASQQKMQKHISHLRQEVMELRHCIRQVDMDLTLQPLHLLKLCARRRLYHSVYQRLRLIATVQQTQPTIQLLLRNSDFVGALDLIATTQDVLQQELQGVKSFRHLGSQLVEMAKAIEILMETDFVHFAQQEVQHRLTLLRLEGTLEGTLEGHSERSDTEERLMSVTYGLVRQGKFSFVATLREELLRILKMKAREIVKTCLADRAAAPGTGSSGEEPTTVALQIKTLTCSSWLAFMSDIFNSMLTELKAIKGCVDVIASVIRAAAEEFQISDVEKQLPSDSSGPDATEQSLQTPVLVEPVKMAPVSLSSDVIPAAFPSAGDLYSALESFEAKSADFEAEDLLEQLALEDELSDVRIHEGAMATGGVPFLEGAMATGGAFIHEVVVTTGGVSTCELPDKVTRTGDGTEEEKDAVKMATGSKADERNVEGETGAATVSLGRCRQLLRDCHEIAAASCDLMHARCTKVLGVRIKAGLLDDIASSDFVMLVRHIERFVTSSAVVTGRQCTQLRAAVLIQAKLFLEHFHSTRRNKLSLLLEAERWKQTDVPAEIQAMVGCLEANIPYSSSATSDGYSQAPAKYLVVHGQKFAIVGIIPLLVKLLHEYCQCACDLPMLVTDVIGKLLELLKFFNELTCGLVLGAGAMKLQLKTITSRHLGLVSRCLLAIMLLIPDVKRLFQHKLVPQQYPLLQRFDTVLKDFGVHYKQIQEKLVDIMGDLIKTQLAKWEAKYPTPSPAMKYIVKQISKLHEALVDILSSDQLSEIFFGVEQAFKEHLRTQLALQGITNNGSTQHGIVNSELQHFKTALSSLGNVTAFGNTLFDVWNTNR